MRPENKSPLDSGLSRALRDAGPYLGLGLSLAVSLLLGLGVGYWIDGKLGTRPIFLLVGAALGMAAAGYQLYMVAVRKR
jgi:ATP synthase protein I